MEEKRSGFARRLQSLRVRRGMDQKTLGELCGLSKNMIGRYERGERTPDIQTAMRIADFFGVTLDDLCGYEKNFFADPQMGDGASKNLLH